MRRLQRARKRYLGQPSVFRRTALCAGAAVAAAIGSGLHAAQPTPGSSPAAHLLPVQQDRDSDFLSDREESAIGYSAFRPDQNGNETPDGIELAQRCAKVIEQLPWDYEITDPNQVHRWLAPTFGIETCPICGITVNMGPAGIRNPLLGLDIECPLIAVHYMSHGSFSHEGDVHSGRTNVPLLLRTLGVRYPHDPNAHELPLDYVVAPDGQLAPDGNDLDGDLLADREELATGLNLYSSDQNENLIPDGIDLARQCAEVIDGLPTRQPDDPGMDVLHKIDRSLRGIEYCEVCGVALNMGGWEIVNPKLNMPSVYLSRIACHYMACGSFSHHGDLHAGRVDIARLLAVLEMPRRCGDLGTLCGPGDLNRDCTVDFTDFGEFARRWLETSDPD